MSSIRAVKFSMEPERTLAFGGIGVGFAAIGVPTTQPVRSFFVTNATDVTLQFSIDGINGHITLLSNTAWSMDICTNQTFSNGQFLPINTTFYVREVGMPTTGSVYVAVTYGNDD